MITIRYIDGPWIGRKDNVDCRPGWCVKVNPPLEPLRAITSYSMEDIGTIEPLIYRTSRAPGDDGVFLAKMEATQ